MSELIDSLREQHWDILSECEALAEFCKKGITAGSNIEQWVSEKSDAAFHLKHFKTSLLDHLKAEDAKLYPLLLKSKDKKAKETAQQYSSEMALISKKVLSFFEKYLHLKADDLGQNRSFKLDLNTVITVLKKRVDVEEKELYPLYDKIKK